MSTTSITCLSLLVTEHFPAGVTSAHLKPWGDGHFHAFVTYRRTGGLQARRRSKIEKALADALDDLGLITAAARKTSDWHGGFSIRRADAIHDVLTARLSSQVSSNLLQISAHGLLDLIANPRVTALFDGTHTDLTSLHRKDITCPRMAT